MDAALLAVMTRILVAWVLVGLATWVAAFSLFGLRFEVVGDSDGADVLPAGHEHALLPELTAH